MKYLLWIFLIVTAFPQAPQNVIGAMDETPAPELKVKIWWDDVSGAQQYNVYKEFNPGGTNSSCPTFTSKPFATVTDNGSEEYSFSDDPAPQLWKVPPTGSWRSQNWWCYAVSAVVNKVESPLSKPVAIAVNDAFYLTLRYQTACSGNIKVVMPFPYLQGQVTAHFYWTDPSGWDHEFPVEQLYNSFGQPSPYNEEWEGKIPVVALDGTMVPWAQTINPTKPPPYRAVVVTPDGGNYVIYLAPLYNADASYYASRFINRVKGGPDCPVGHDLPGSNIEWWQNVLK